MKNYWVLLFAAVSILTLGLTAADAQAEGSVEGTVVDADGDAVDGALVMLHGEMVDRGQRPFRAETETDGNGSFEFDEVPAGDYWIAAINREVGGAREQIEVTDDQVTRVALELQGRGDDGRGGDDEPEGEGTVEGIVVTSDGEAVPGVRVEMMPIRRGHNRPIRTRTDDQGEFTFDDVPVGRYMVRASMRGAMAMVRIEIIADQNHRVRLELLRFDRRGDDDNDRRRPGDRRRRWQDRE